MNKKIIAYVIKQGAYNGGEAKVTFCAPSNEWLQQEVESQKQYVGRTDIYFKIFALSEDLKTELAYDIRTGRVNTDFKFF